MSLSQESARIRVRLGLAWARRLVLRCLICGHLRTLVKSFADQLKKSLRFLCFHFCVLPKSVENPLVAPLKSRPSYSRRPRHVFVILNDFFFFFELPLLHHPVALEYLDGQNIEANDTCASAINTVNRKDSLRARIYDTSQQNLRTQRLCSNASIFAHTRLLQANNGCRVLSNQAAFTTHQHGAHSLSGFFQPMDSHRRSSKRPGSALSAEKSFSLTGTPRMSHISSRPTES